MGVIRLMLQNLCKSCRNSVLMMQRQHVCVAMKLFEMFKQISGSLAELEMQKRCEMSKLEQLFYLFTSIKSSLNM